MPNNQNFNSYGGYVWSDEPPEGPGSDGTTFLTLGAAAAAGLGTFNLAQRMRSENGVSLIDLVSSTSRFAGNLSPFQIGNTFRISEFFSPFTTPRAQGLNAVGDKFTYSWDQATLKTDETLQYLKAATGLSTAELAQKGITQGMVGAPDQVATSLIFERTSSSSRGALYSVLNGKKELLSDAIQLMSLTPETSALDVFNYKTNRAALAAMQALDVFPEADDFDEAAANVFKPEAKDVARPKFMPMPSTTGSVESIGDLGRRTAFVRSFSAFNMNRFADLVQGTTESLFGKETAERFGEAFHFGISSKKGPGSHMFMRYGMKAAAVGGIAMGIQQADWAKRQWGVLPDMMINAGVSAGTAYFANKLTRNPKTAMAAGVASFFGQVVLPGFDQGVIPGLATTYTMATKLRAVGVNPMNYYRRMWEGMLPGVSDWKTGAFLGVVGVGASMARMPFGQGQKISNYLLDEFSDTLGVGRIGGSSNKPFVSPRTTREIFYEDLKAQLAPFDDDVHAHSYKGRAKLHKLAYESDNFTPQDRSLTEHMNTLWSQAEETMKEEAKLNPLNKRFVERLTEIDQKYGAMMQPDNMPNNFIVGMAKEIAGFAEQVKFGFLGADVVNPDVVDRARNLGFRGGVGRIGAGLSIFAGIMGAQQIAFGGLLGSMETYQELEDQYSGRTMVKIKKSRWWEGGGTPFEGSNSDFYYRPHAYHLMMNRVREAGVYGEDEDRISPIGKFFRKNFTYELEKKNYYDRPYPITNAAFADIPVVGGLLAGSIGRLIKPARLMHTGEWMSENTDGGIQYAHVYKGSRREPAYSLGGTGEGNPVSPYSSRAISNFLIYQERELSGLTGFVRNTITDILTGEQQPLSTPNQLADSGLMTSPRIAFWESNMGGLFFSNEAIRRLLPSYRSEIEKYNPIMNSQPSWMPDKFRYGDPYRSVEWGEARLAGAGYAALHPELKGLDPEDYPLVYQYAILSDVAPFSKEAITTRNRLYSLRAKGQTTEAMNMMIDEADQRMKALYNQHNFEERVHRNAIHTPGISQVAQSGWFGAKQFVRDVTAPAEYLPITFGLRPSQKLLGDRDMIAQYEYERLYGTPYAFWDKPWRDWGRPAIYSAASLLGFEGKPQWRQEADEMNDYFDKLEFVKYMNLASQAEQMGDQRAAARFKNLAARTTTGVNPMGNPLGIYWAMPDQERKFFNAFAQAKGADRQRILEMVPENQRSLYETVWSRIDSGDPGMYAGSDLKYDDAHLAAQFSGVQEYFSDRPMPREDFIGWHEDVNLSDIQVRYVNELGRELQDYGLWESQLRSAMQQQYLEGSTDFLHEGNGINNGYAQIMAGHMHQTFSDGANHPVLSIHHGGSSSSGHLTYNDNRRAETLQYMNRQMNEY